MKFALAAKVSYYFCTFYFVSMRSAGYFGGITLPYIIVDRKVFLFYRTTRSHVRDKTHPNSCV